MIKVTSSGNYSRTRHALERILRGDIFSDLDKYGQIGVHTLASATPVRTGKTQTSWEYRVVKTHRRIAIEWYNTNLAGNSNVSVAVLIQFGHGTGTGGYVQGYDYINPAIRPIFDDIAEDIWKKVVAK